MRYSNGLAAVATRRVDAGEVMFFTTAAAPGWKADSPDPTWTDWPLRPEYIPFMNVAVSHLLHRQTQSHNAVAGEALRWLGQEDDAGRSFTVVTPAGEKVRLGMPEVVQGRPVVTHASPQTAGVYRLLGAAPPRAAKGKEPAPAPKESEETTGLPFAVVPDLRESASLDALSEGQLNELLGFRPVHAVAGTDPGSFTAADLGHQEWAMWLFLAALVALLGESVLAWFTGRAW
jgi:hypothetical protein